MYAMYFYSAFQMIWPYRIVMTFYGTAEPFNTFVNLSHDLQLLTGEERLKVVRDSLIRVVKIWIGFFFVALSMGMAGFYIAFQFPSVTDR